MKRFISIVLLLTCMLSFSNCSSEDYDEKYSDPNKVTKLLIDKLTVGIFIKENNFAIQGYGRYYSSDTQWLGKYAQCTGFNTGNIMYYNGFSVDSYYGDLYSSAANFKKLEQMYNELDEPKKPTYEAYYLAAKIHVYCHLLAILDIYGNIPWTDACQVAVTGDFTFSNAHFDDAQTLYTMIIKEMKEAGLRFADKGVSIPKDFTSTQDFVNKADRRKWQMYANSLCLRAAMRIASNGPLTDLGRATVKEILENPGTYPVVNTNDDNIQIVNLRTDPVNAEGGGGLGDQPYCRLASGAIVRNMLGNYNKTTYSGTYQESIDDPRLPLLYNMATPNGKLTGYPSMDPNKEEASVFRGTDPQMNLSLESTYNQGSGFSWVRENGFFWRNENWDHQIYSAAETWFIKAEAYQNGWASGDAKAAFTEGIKQSIRFFFKYQKNNSRSDYKQDEKGTERRAYVITPKEPSDEWINQFAEARWSKRIDGSSYDSSNPQIDAIMTQKWLSFNLLYVREAWSDLRRTGYPSGLVFPKVSDPLIPNVPNRWRYPGGERDFNANFTEVESQDNYYDKLFWAK